MSEKVYFIIDESYDKNLSGFYVISFLVLEGRDTFYNLAIEIQDFLKKSNLKEFKNHATSERFKNRFFKIVEKTNFRDYHCIFPLKKGESLTALHSEGVRLFTGFMIAKYRGIDQKIVFDFRIDNVGGPKYQEQCKKMIRNLCGQNQIKTDILFSDSQKQVCLQMSDLFAGEIRRNLYGKIEIEGLLQKSKNLQD